MSSRFEIDCTGGILDLQDTKPMYCLNDSEICELLNNQDQKIVDLETKLAEKDKAIENWQTMYESVMQTCHNDKEEIERLNKQLALSEKALQIAIFELDFAKNHSQSTNSETYERILNLRDKILKQAKEMMKSE